MHCWYMSTNTLPRFISDVITSKYFAQPCGISLNFCRKKELEKNWTPLNCKSLHKSLNNDTSVAPISEVCIAIILALLHYRKLAYDEVSNKMATQDNVRSKHNQFIASYWRHVSTHRVIIRPIIEPWVWYIKWNAHFRDPVNMVQWLAWWWLCESKHVATITIGNKLVVLRLNDILSDSVKHIGMAPVTMRWPL
jgi:hypothetical protein